MTTLQQVELQCPVCDTKFRSQSVLSTNSFGGKRTDFHERAAGTQPLPYLVHTCHHCGFSGDASTFEHADYVDADVKQRVWDELAPRVAQGSPTGSEKYEAAALVALWEDEPIRRVADFWLRAAWCCVDEGDTEAERYYRIKAAGAFTDALATYDGVDGKERPVITYLVGELWRRIGDTNCAARWFDLVAEEVTDPPNQQWVIDAARQQRDCPREWFG